MIRNEAEYREAVERLQEERQNLDQHRVVLEKLGLTPDELKRLMDPLTSFHLQLQEEVDSYERLMRGEIDELRNLQGLGQLLISLRIAKGMSQQQLAERLGVSPSQVSRDERNEYHGVTVERAARVMAALGARISLHVELDDACAAVG
jgi:DNA-directed RNA polymerase specialized sigma subunit